MRSSLFFLLCFGFGCWVSSGCGSPKKVIEPQKNQWIAQAPAGQDYCLIDRLGVSILPNGRKISPAGTTVLTAPHPYGLVLSPDGKTVVTANSGTAPFSISVVEGLKNNNLTVRQIPEGAKNDEGILESVFMGLAITPDNNYVYVAGGQSNKIFKFRLRDGVKTDSIVCAVKVGEKDYTHGYIGDMRLTKDGNTLFAVDQVGFRLLVIDTRTNTILHHIPTGRYPFGLALSPDENRVFVANVGMFEYSPLQSLDVKDFKNSSAFFPVSAYNSREMREGIQTDSIKAAGLGDPNDEAACSVWSYDMLQGKPVIGQKMKTGFLVGQQVDGISTVGGASPNSIVATQDFVFVSNGNNDCITVLSTKSNQAVRQIKLIPDTLLARYRGIIPFGLAISPDEKTLYVAEAGINAIGVVDIVSGKVKGHIPTGWFPSKLAVSPDGTQLLVANAKGYGSGPNGGSTFVTGPEGTYIGSLMKGSISRIEIPNDEQLVTYTRQVLANNFNFTRTDDAKVAYRANNPIPMFGGHKESPIKHIVFISKENRTYDEVFGQLKAGKGEADMARYGYNRSFSNHEKTDSVQEAIIMPNHLALAQRFAISDNFYVDSDHSADGHRWLVSTYPNEWVETSVASAYGGKRGMEMLSKAPGNWALVGASGAIYPEDYNEAGSLWEHLDRNGKSVHNFGFGVELAGSYEDSTLKYGGVRTRINYPLPAPLYSHSSRMYPTYNMAIPDQFRVDIFQKEFTEQFLGDGKVMPDVLTLILPNDHGAGERPQAGYPFRESYMADNDLALGRIVEFLSRTPYWKNMAIVVTEDDSQDGRDHIDAHRSLLMVISPYARQNYVGHTHYSFGSIFKTFWNVLGIPWLNQFDAGATDLHDLFTDKPNLSPYTALPVDARVFDPQKALTPFDENFDWKALGTSPALDNVEDFLKTQDKNK